MQQGIKSFVIAAAAFVVLRYFGGFSEKQSVILTVLLWLVYDLVSDMRRATQEHFTPYTLWIEPKWRDLLRDYKLVSDDQWGSLSFRLAAIPESKYHVLRSGFRLTFLKPQPFEGLIYREDRKCFNCELDFRERIEEIELPLSDTHVPFSPTLFVRWGKEGYDIGITTPESFRRSNHHRDNRDLIIVATLPYETFQLYANHSSNFFGKRAETSRRTALDKHGWKLEERDPDLPNWPDSLEHKYFYASLRSI